jgi:SM-20-related protein
MPGADFFGRYGLFTINGFLDEQACALIRAEMRRAPAIPGDVGLHNGEYVVDERIRKVLCAAVRDSTIALIENRLRTLKPLLESHFAITLGSNSPPQFLVYEDGAFYRPHRDSRSDPGAAEFSKARQISVSIFLNGERPSPELNSYGGGSLTFYELFNNPPGVNIGFPLVGACGLLVAFPSNMLHSVAPITHGVRYSIVTWFYGSEQ